MQLVWQVQCGAVFKITKQNFKAIFIFYKGLMPQLRSTIGAFFRTLSFDFAKQINRTAACEELVKVVHIFKGLLSRTRLVAGTECWQIAADRLN